MGSATLTIEGYCHRMIWLSGEPCDETSSLSCMLHCSAQTCECVSTSLRHAPELEFQKRIMRSAVPPPDASRFLLHGHQASALTAAWCASRRCKGVSQWPLCAEV